MSIMTISSKFLTVLAIMGGTVLAAVTSGFTTAKDPDPTYFFEHQPGTTVSNPSNWNYTPDGTDCNGDGKSCKIELTEDYVDLNTSPISIDTTVLPQIPTVTSQVSPLQVPDEDAGIF
jgi:hypothetical protein